ncbi:MAG: hypothetical protein PVG75_03525, partial [Thioalkalispiraceae bacterium]
MRETLQPAILLGLGSIGLLCLLPSLIVHGHAGHTPAGKPAVTAAVGPVSVQACGHSEHLGPHNNTQPVRRDHTTGRGNDQRAVTVNNKKGLRCQTLSELTTPLAGRMRASAKRAFMHNNNQYFEEFAYIETRWPDLQVFPAVTELWASCWLAVTKRITEPAQAHDTEVTSILTQSNARDWNRLKPLKATVSLATSPPLIQTDGVSWEGAIPMVSYILTSRTHTKKGIFYIDYQLQNKTGENLSFFFAQIRTDEFPTGWYGAVKAHSSLTISIAVDKPEALYIQKTQAYFWTMDDPAEYQAVPLHMYANQSALEFKGQVKTLRARFDPVHHANHLEFQLAGDSAEMAVIYRDSVNGLELIKTLEQPIEANTLIKVIDAAPPPGEVRYRLKAGRGINGRYSEPVSVS